MFSHLNDALRPIPYAAAAAATGGFVLKVASGVASLGFQGLGNLELTPDVLTTICGMLLGVSGYVYSYKMRQSTLAADNAVLKTIVESKDQKIADLNERIKDLTTLRPPAPTP